jgi:hypothetical protein
MRCPFFIKRGRCGMITVETIGRIRLEHLLKGKTIREIARDLRVSRNTVPSRAG